VEFGREAPQFRVQIHSAGLDASVFRKNALYFAGVAVLQEHQAAVGRNYLLFSVLAVDTHATLSGSLWNTSAGIGSKGRGTKPGRFRLSHVALLAFEFAPAGLAGLFVEFPLAQLLGGAAPFQKLFEAAQGGADVFPVKEAHSQRHNNPQMQKVMETPLHGGLGAPTAPAASESALARA
jgi:hypothetical protein